MKCRPNNTRIRKKLLSKRSELLEEMGLARREALAPSGDEGDQAAALHDGFVSLSVGDLANRQIREIEAALARLEAGEYGYCQSCDGEIPRKRLDFIPWARFCVSCQERKSPMGAQQSWDASLNWEARARTA